MNPIKYLQSLGDSYKQGFQAANIRMLKKGDRTHGILPVQKRTREFYRYLGEDVPAFEHPMPGGQPAKKYEASKGIKVTEPVKYAGALGARLLTDLSEDATRHLYWRHNHPMAIADRISDAVVGERLYEAGYSPTQRAAITLAGIGAPTAASLGVWDITNPGEQFRPKGYAQSYADVGSEDRRKTGQPGLETVERMVLGRRGRPLKYETAKAEIPNLTPQKYSQFMRDYYQNKGLTGLGLLKGTMENIEGHPEARIIGFPVGLQAAGALAGGAGAIRAALPKGGSPRARMVMAAGALGAGGGMAAGKLTNMAIAAANRPTYPSTYNYQ
jgi:hypothetical protein